MKRICSQCLICVAVLLMFCVVTESSAHAQGGNPCGASKGGCDTCTTALEKTGGYGVDHPCTGQEHHNQGGE